MNEKMTYRLGIDAGGTYTDAAILDNLSKDVITSNKVLTTYPDILQGIKAVIDGIDNDILKNVKFVSVSTTLATNTILENTGYPVALVLVGDYLIPQETPIERYIMVKGGHDTIGAEIEPLDMDSVKNFVQKVKNEVSAFAISSYFSMRNPEHELEIKKYIVQETNLPVVCGHELSQDLGAYERGATAYLNAQLIPIARQFTNSIVTEIEERGIDAKVMMLKCDGSLINIKEAIERPIESIFTGPAASLMGASFLSKKNTCIVVDVGGTSTDVSLINNGLPELCEEGAKVGDWHTKVKAIRIETSAMGGDSHVWISQRKIHIGPRRVMPLCVASVKYPKFKEMLRTGHAPAGLMLKENIQPTKFYVKTGKAPIELSQQEKILYDIVKDEPTSLSDIYWKIGNAMYLNYLDTLIQKRLIQAIGFTPTDALHVLNEYNYWDREASFIGATILSRLLQIDDEHDVALSIKEQVSYNMVLNLMSYLLPNVNKNEIEKILKIDSFSKFKLSIPVVLLGGPVSSYTESIKKIIDAEVILPQCYSVGNAIGALIGQTFKKVEILIRPTIKIRQKIFLVFTSKGLKEFATYKEAVEYAEQIGTEIIMDYMKEYGIESEKIKITISQENLNLHDGSGMLIETKIVCMGIGGT